MNKNSHIAKTIKHWPFLIFVIFYLFFALFTFKDYGITLDEYRQYHWGRKMLGHLTQETTFRNTIQFTYDEEEKNQRHTPILSTYYRGYTALLTSLNPSEHYEKYHFMNMAFAGLVFLAAYFLLYDKTKNPYLSLIGPVFIVLSPRFLGHIPANPKDMPFAVVYFLALTAIYFSKYMRDDYLKIFVLGFFFFMAQSFRVIGLSIYIVYFVYLLYSKELNFKDYKRVMSRLFLTGVFATFLMVITWPYLGASFFQNFGEILSNSSNFEAWNKEIPFMGNLISPETRPWYYLFVYLFLTAPLFLVLNIGVFFLTYFQKKKIDGITLIFGSAFVVNILLYLFLRPTVYNGLRHFLFLLPILSIVAALGFNEFIKSKKYRLPFLIVNVVFMVAVLLQIVKLHPYQYIYFNPVFINLSENANSYEIEYWGASYKEGVEWLLSNVSQESYKVATCNNTFAVKYFSKDKFDIVKEFSQADYILCDEIRYSENIPGEVVYQVERQGVSILRVLKRSV